MSDSKKGNQDHKGEKVRDSNSTPTRIRGEWLHSVQPVVKEGYQPTDKLNTNNPPVRPKDK